MKKKGKRILPCLLTLMFLLGLVPMTVFAAPPTQGSGTSADPYIISTAEEFIAFCDDVSEEGNTYLEKYIRLDADITLTDQNWTPVGVSNTKPFKGTFDGNGHIITIDLQVNKIQFQNYAGLFGYVDTMATIKNLNVAGSLKTEDGTQQNNGSITGTNKGLIYNCHSSAAVSGGVQTGGIAGSNDGTIEACSYSGTVTGVDSYTGGIVGMNGNGKVRKCYNSGTINGVNYVGGIAGSNGKGMEFCYNTGSVSGNKAIGGLAGFNFSTTSYSYSTGSVSGNESVGLLFGMKNGAVTNSYFLSDSVVDEGENSGTCKTSEQFASGEVTYLLNNGVTDGTQVFYQTCGQGLPAYSGQTVYQIKNYACPGDTVGTDAYSNTDEDVTGEHSYTQERAEDQYLKSTATCTEPAVYYKSCTGCGLASTTETFVSGTALGHSVVKVEGKAPTATKTGNITYWYCSRCGKYFKDSGVTQEITKEETVLAATGENVSESTTYNPKTGDSSNMELWVVLLLLAFGSMSGALLYKKIGQ